MEFLRSKILYISVFLFATGPMQALAQAGTGPSFSGSIVPTACASGGPCTYCHLMDLAEKVIEFLVFFAIIVAILGIIWAGFLYVTAAGNTGQISKAHAAFRVAIFGLIITLAAFLIIELIVLGLGVTGQIGDPWTLPGC